MGTIVLQPGYLVGLATTIRGGVNYTREDIGIEREGVRVVSEWKTKKVISDEEAFEEAVKTRGRCRTLVTRCCSASAFGLLCRISDEKDLDDGIREAKQLAEAFNDRALGIHIGVFVMKGKIAETDEEAVRGVSAELGEILSSMRDGISQGDVKAIRDGANKARVIGRMLDEASANRVTEAVTAAREAAKKIVKEMTNGLDKAEAAAKAIAETRLDVLDEARFSFLDFAQASQSLADSVPDDSGSAIEVEPLSVAASSME